MLNSKQIKWLCFILPPLLIICAVFSGQQNIQWLLNNEVGHTILWQIRIPRALLAFLIGAMLSWAGVIIQGMVRNPLADPGLIGVSGGAAVCVAAVFWLAGMGILLPAWAQPLAAFIGAVLALLLVLKISANQTDSMSYLILAGIAVSVLAGAIIGLLSYLATDNALRQISFWSMGSLSAASWNWVWVMLIALVPALMVWSKRLESLDALLLGELNAQALGVSVKKLQWQVIFWTALFVALTVAAAGMISFVGLVSPHLARLLTGASHKRVLPLAVVLGGGLLVLADIFARTLIAPAEIPIGIITALIGGPVFIMLLVREKRLG